MIVRAMVLAAAVMAGAGAAHAHAQVLDAGDPAVTERPSIRQSMRTPSLPAGSKGIREHGEVGLTVCVDVTGNVVAAGMSKSSGYQLLDEATLAWIRSGLNFKPALSGNKPVAVCNYVFTYVWNYGSGKKDVTESYVAWSDIKPEERPSIATQVNGPFYPPKAVLGRIEGTVRLSLCITPFGRMVSATPIEGDMDSSLISATSSWIGRFTFNPGKQDGQTVGVCGFPIKYVWELPS
jgi:TonB family protein